MAFLGFISKLFGKKSAKPIETVEVDAAQLAKWFDNRVNAVFTELSGEIKSLLAKIEEEIADAEKNLEVLEKAKLMNDNIPEKVRVILEGNRESHLQKNRQFLQALILPEKISHASVSAFCSEFSSNLEQLAKQTTKSYQIMQEFFADESGEIAQNLKNIDNYVKSIQESLNNKSGDVNLVGDIKDMTKLLEHRIALKTDTFKAMDDEDSKEKFLISEKMRVEEMISQLKNSPEFAKLENYTRKKEALKMDILHHKEELHRIFLPLEKALKKFEHINIKDSKLIGFYLGNELDALRLDKDLQIVQVLSELKEKIDDDSIALNEKQKEKALEAIQGITTSKLNSVLQSVKGKRGDVEEIDRQIRLINIGNDLDDMQYKLKHIEDRIKKIQLNRVKIEKSIDKVDIVGLKLDIQQKIKELLGVNLIIFQDTEKERSAAGDGAVEEGAEKPDGGSAGEEENDRSLKTAY